MRKKLASFVPIFIIVTLGIWAMKALLLPDFFTSHDGPSHLSRLAQYLTALRDGQLPPRWSGSLYGMLGYPIFVYSYHLPFAIGSLFYALGANLHQSIELVLGLGYLVSGLGMYMFLREFYNRAPATAGAVLFMLAPYRLSLIFVRAAIGETTAIALLPWILYGVTAYIKRRGRQNLAVAGLSLAGAIASHSLFIPMYLPVVWLYTMALSWPALRSTGIKSWLKPLTIITAAGLAISCFYWLPLIFERRYTVFDEVYTNQGQNHLVTWQQLWHSPWGYGFSFPDTANDAMSFQVGWAQILAVLGGLSLVATKGLKSETAKLTAGATVIFVLTLALMLETPAIKVLWQSLDVLRMIDFPWRFLGMATAASAICGAFVAAQIKPSWLIAGLIISAAIVANRNHLRINLPYLVDETAVWADTGTTAYANEYRPVWRATSLRNTISDRVESDGPAQEWKLLESQSNMIEIQTSFTRPQILQINSLFFPGWQAYRNSSENWQKLQLGDEWVIVNFDTYKYPKNQIIGTMQILASPGEQKYRLVFRETWLRRLGDWISLIALGWLTVWTFRAQATKNPPEKTHQRYTSMPKASKAQSQALAKRKSTGTRKGKKART